jgi:hypothetical protein
MVMVMSMSVAAPLMATVKLIPTVGGTFRPDDGVERIDWPRSVGQAQGGTDRRELFTTPTIGSPW